MIVQAHVAPWAICKLPDMLTTCIAVTRTAIIVLQALSHAMPNDTYVHTLG